MGAICLAGRARAVLAVGVVSFAVGCSAGEGLPTGTPPGSDGDGDGSGSGAASQDTDAPVFLDGSVTSDSEGNATLWWLTDEESTTAVVFGTSPDASDLIEGSSELVESHEMQLTGLETGQLYFFRGVSSDASGNEGKSKVFRFVQGETGNDTEGPDVGPVDVVVDDSPPTASLSWSTGEPATCVVEYGLDTSYGETVAGPPEAGTQHAVLLEGLAPDTFYHFRVVATDLGGNETATSDSTFFTGDPATGDASVSGELVAWHPVTIDFEGPAATESDPGPNPFLDYRLVVRMVGPSGQVYAVPGFFDGDGQGGGAGNVWRVRFAPDEGGTWSYEAFFRGGPEVAVSLDPGVGAPLAPDGQSGTLTVAPADPEAKGFLAWGRLEYVGEHYLKFRDGSYFLKGGTDSPENFLGYRGFDNTIDQPGGANTSGLQNGIHRYEAHGSDFVAGEDPWFTSDLGGNSKGIIGALNYLSSVHVNSVYFLPMNLGGDGRESFPFVGAVNNGFDKTHYDVSKLTQWNVVFEHAVEKGILLHFVLAETESENENWLDGGGLGVERKLFFREMVARFGHNLAVKWNLSEENDFSNGEVEAFAGYIDAVDPYDHPIGFHTKYLPSSSGYGDYDQVLGDPRFRLTSIQGAPEHAGGHVETWRAASAASGHKWVVDVDELGPAGEGLTDTNAVERRKKALWDVYLSGGNIEWYGGYHSLPLGGDMRLEDFRTREEMWNYTWYARRFVQEHLPFWEMEPRDDLVTGESGAYGGAEVFAKVGEVYAVYYPDAASTGSLDLGGTSGSFSQRWYNPRTGEFAGPATAASGGGTLAVGAPPASGQGETTFVESGGLVVIQAESVPPSGQWEEETELDGFTGASYYRWDGPNLFGEPGQGVLRYTLEITTPGTYQLRLRNRHDHQASDQENDCWARMDGGTWVKVFSNDGAASVGVWNWLSTFEHGNGSKEPAHYDLDAGTHVLELSGRSANYKLDRLHLYLPGVQNPQDLSQPESETGSGPGSGGAGEDWVLLVKR